VPAEKPLRVKTTTLSLRLDPKTKFIVEFIARIRGQSITTVVERAIKETADNIKIRVEYDQYDMEQFTTWSDFWDPEEGVRMLKLFAEDAIPTTFDEDELKAFTLAHRSFFYAANGREPKRHAIEILWPNIDKYLAIWRDKKRSDYWAAGEAMKADLAAARLAAPEWPPKASPPAKSTAT
jgi:uncharacterized protein (DUF1778 family)